MKNEEDVVSLSWSYENVGIGSGIGNDFRIDLGIVDEVIGLERDEWLRSVSE